MKKIISLLLAVMLVVSVAAVAAGAAGTAKITVAGTDGKTETKTFNVGDTFTVYTTLYSAQFDGKIASIMGKQDYTDSVVSLANALVEEEGMDKGMVENTEEMFPVANNSNTIANGANSGSLLFTATEPAPSKAFVFDSNDCLLIVSKYTVNAEGEAQIKTGVETLATNDLYLTKIISKGVVQGDYKVTIHSSFSYPAPEDDFLLGDVTRDGKVNVQDCTAILRYVRQVDTLDDDQLKRGDVTGDGKVNVQDVTRILRHVRQIDPLY